MDRLEPSYLACRDLNSVVTTVWNSSQSHCTNSDLTPKYTPKSIENVGSHENLYMNVHISIIHNSHKVETTEMSISWRMDNFTHAMKYYSALERNEKLTYATI